MKQNRFLPLILLFVFAIQFASAHNQKFHRIKAKLTQTELNQLMEAGLDIDHFSFKNGELIAEVSESDIEIIKKNKIKFSYLLKDLEKNYQKHNAMLDKQKSKIMATTFPTPSNFALGTYGGYFTYQEMQNQLDQMRALYPNLITVKTSIGNSIQNRPLWMVKISDNPDVDENEPEVFFNAAHHAREPLGMSQLIFFMWYVLENYNSDKEIKALLNSNEIYIVPCVNPDGYVYNQTTNPNGGGMWRKNRRNNGSNYGVDLNRNYSYGWGGSGASSSSSSDTYRGASAFSEPETQAIRDFSISRNFITSFDFHSYGNYCIYPFGGAITNTNPEVALYNQISAYLTSDNSFVYGNAYATVGYVASGCGDDWRYGEQTTKNKTYSFTPEIGPSSMGFYPSSSNIIPLCNTTVLMNKGMLKLSTNYAEVNTNMSSTINSLNSFVPYTIKNYSLAPSNYTVSINPLSNFVTSVAAPNVYSSMTTLQTTSGQINFYLDPATPFGTNISLEVSTTSPYHTRLDTISFVYDCTAPGGTISSGITTTDASLNWAPVSGSTDYYVSYKETSASAWGPEQLVSGTGITLNGLTPNTSYAWKVRTSNCSAYSSVQNFSTLSNSVTYCASYGSSDYYSWIDYFKLNNLTRSSGKDGGYYDGTNLIANVFAGNTYTMQVSTGYRRTKYRVYYRVWIDYNNNGSFNDPGEQVYSTNSTSSGTLSYSLTIPSSVSPGTKRIRVSMRQGSAYPTSCETFTYGEVEDYTINVQSNVVFKTTESEVVTKFEQMNVSITPNPFNDYINIQMDNKEETMVHVITLNDMNGRILYKEVLEDGILSQSIPTDNLSQGLYILSITSDNGTQSFKVIK